MINIIKPYQTYILINIIKNSRNVSNCGDDDNKNNDDAEEEKQQQGDDEQGAKSTFTITPDNLFRKIKWQKSSSFVTSQNPQQHPNYNESSCIWSPLAGN